MKRIKTTAIVPVYNEQKSVANVVWALLLSPSIDQVVAVDDGSTDQSLTILKSFNQKIDLVVSKTNQGKGWAISQGIKKAQHPIVSFWDADTVNLQEKYITKLLEPLLKKQADGVIGQEFKNQVIPRKWLPVCGERAYFKKDLQPHLQEMAKSRFGIEMLLNHLYKDKKIALVKLIGLGALTKFQKHGTAAYREYYDEALEVIKQIQKQTNLSPSDAKIFKSLKKMTKLSQLENKINKLKNQEIKDLLKNYLIKYLKKAKNFFES